MTNGTCSTPDCERPPFCRGMCRRHYDKATGRDGGKPAVCETCGVDYVRNRKARTNCCPPCSDRTPAKIEAARRNQALRRKNWPQSKVHFSTCIGCGELFTSHRKRKYCGDECYPKSVWPTRPCSDCGGPKELLDSYCAECKCKRLVAARARQRRKPGRDRGNHRRRARRFGVSYEPINMRRVYERDGWICGICGDAIDPDARYPDIGSASLDHVVPLSRGGGHLYSNVQASHWMCNTLKGSVMEEAPRGQAICSAA